MKYKILFILVQFIFFYENNEVMLMKFNTSYLFKIIFLFVMEIYFRSRLDITRELWFYRSIGVLYDVSCITFLDFKCITYNILLSLNIVYCALEKLEISCIYLYPPYINKSSTFVSKPTSIFQLLFDYCINISK